MSLAPRRRSQRRRSGSTGGTRAPHGALIGARVTSAEPFPEEKRSRARGHACAFARSRGCQASARDLHSFTNTYMHACMHAYIHTYRHTYIHTLHAYMHTYIHACMHVCMYAYIHTYIQTYIYIYIYVYTHTYT